MQARSRHRRRTKERERYRDVAETALPHLDWVIDYLYEIRRPRIAAALRRNRNQIANRLD